MANFRNGSLHLFRAFGIDVFVHWSWFPIAALFVFGGFLGMTPVWGLLTYVTLFGIVLLHEFGHALACRSVGGTAKTIMLWPLGGIAFVSPPQRPGAVLWSITAGPLVNVLLLPIFGLLWLVTAGLPATGAMTGLQEYIQAVFLMNAFLLVFNLLPVYPLDGGQIVQSILWFFLGRTRSLRIVSIAGMVAAAMVGLLLLASGAWVSGPNGPLLVVIVLFIGWQAYNGYRTAQYLARQEQMADVWRVVRRTTSGGSANGNL